VRQWLAADLLATLVGQHTACPRGGEGAPVFGSIFTLLGSLFLLLVLSPTSTLFPDTFFHCVKVQVT